MELLLIGTSHRVADVDVRGRIATAFSDVTGLLPRVPFLEHLVMATCHRVEVVAVVNDVDAASRELRQFVREVSGADLLAPGASTYALTGEAAVAHVCRVACGLDSMVVGEAEIAGQLRRAVTDAKRAGTVGVLLDRVFAGAFRASGISRSRTRIGAGALSASSAAVTMVEHALGGLDGRAVLVIGAGQAGRQALARLKKRRAGALFIASRSPHHAREAAGKHGAEVVALDEVASVVSRVDAVLAAAQAPAHLLTAAGYQAASTGRSVFMVDLSAPRVLDPTLASIPGVTLKSVDDLGDIVRASAARRLQEVPKVEAIVRDEARRAYEQFIARRDRRAAQSSVEAAS